MDSGAGDDYLDMGYGNAKGYYCTVSGGAGNDYIGLVPPGMTYIYSSGNDTLEKFGLEDTLVIGDLSINSSVRGNDGDITLNMSNLTSVVPDTNPTISVASGTDGNDVFDGVGGAN